jgi:hypothetical protein
LGVQPFRLWVVLLNGFEANVFNFIVPSWVSSEFAMEFASKRLNWIWIFREAGSELVVAEEFSSIVARSAQQCHRQKDFEEVELAAQPNFDNRSNSEDGFEDMQDIAEASRIITFEVFTEPAEK